jgi:TPR repeat protein
MNKIIVMMIGILVCGMNMPIHAVKKAIVMPQTIGIDLAGKQQPPEWIELDDNETFTRKPFAQLIENSTKVGIPFILARIMTRSEYGYEVHYVDAHSINGVYGAYPFTHHYKIMSVIDPVNGLPIRNIDYFIISNPNAVVFEYLCCDLDSITGVSKKAQLYRNIFYVNQQNNRTLSAQAALRLESSLAQLEEINPALAISVKVELIQLYYYGSTEVAKDWIKARDYCMQIKDQQINAGAAIVAKGRLGEIYYKGSPDGIIKNYAMARDFLIQVKDQQINPAVAITANIVLGQIYYAGGFGAEQNYVKSRSCWINADQDIDPRSATVAKVRLGEIYYYGRGTEKNYVTARDYLMQVKDQQFDRGIAIRARELLGEIYLEGGYGVAQDYVQAGNLLTQLADQKDDLKVAQIARKKLDELNKSEASRSGQGESSGRRPVKKQKLEKQ